MLKIIDFKMPDEVQYLSMNGGGIDKDLLAIIYKT